MKKLIALVVLSTTLCSGTMAQSTSSVMLPTDFLGVGLGLNATGLIGVTYEHVFKEQIGVYANAGIGGWGYKLGAGGRYYFRNVHSGAVGVNFSHVSGAEGIQSELTVIENGAEVRKEVIYDAKPVQVLNLSYLKFWRMGKQSRFNLEVGYSVPLSGKGMQNYTIHSPVVLTQTSKDALTIVQPGGLIFGIGFTFGL